MIPGINSRQAKQMMRKMGINQEELDSTQVIIKLKDKNLIIDDPSVSKIKMGGSETFQISGIVKETSQDSFEITDDDIQTVVTQTSCSKTEAKSALKKSKGDIAEAIVSLS